MTRWCKEYADSPAKTTRNSGGFTLVEVVVALTILGLLALALFLSFRMAVNSYQKGQERMEEQAHKRVLEDMIKRQVGSLFPLRPAISMANLQQTGMDPAEALAFAQAPLFFGSPESMTFITVAPLLLHENPGLTVVRYGLAQDEWGNRYLGAMETQYLGVNSFTFMVNDPRGKPLPLIEPAQEVLFEYYGYDNLTQTYDWYPVWDPNEMRSVPSAVRIHVDQKSFVVPINANFSGPMLPTSGIVGVGR
ncbi:MAG TPA: prepilin-type N-terminal cleavage/methylation domain-containing protein [Acidobacteriota bacterium]|nr:prepilin-type N-terminal cleavage/methylation domain-containing protein [Acidobacteriota bacterium]